MEQVHIHTTEKQATESVVVGGEHSTSRITTTRKGATEAVDPIREANIWSCKEWVDAVHENASKSALGRAAVFGHLLCCVD